MFSIASAQTQKKLPIRPAVLEDVSGISKLLGLYADLGILLPRSDSDIYQSLRDFRVVDDGTKVIACAALLIYNSDLAEVRSLAVHPDYQQLGLGYRVVEQLESEAVRLGLKKLMALTYVVEFFEKLQFHVVDMGELPEKVWGACINCHKFQHCDEIAVLKHL